MNVIPFDQLAPMLRVIPSLPRPVLAKLTERLIEHLDGLDGDPDLEDDDPAGDTLDEHGEHPVDDGRELLKTKPTYDLDQSRGPNNEREANRIRDREAYRLS